MTLLKSVAVYAQARFWQLTFHHPHLPATFPYDSHDTGMGNCILDLHRGAVNLLIIVIMRNKIGEKPLTFNFRDSFKSLYI